VRNCPSQGYLVIGGIRRKERVDDLAECWACSWSIAEIHPDISEVMGEDPLDAFLNCIRLIQNLIFLHEEIGWKIWWLVEGDKGGLLSVLEDVS